MPIESDLQANCTGHVPAAVVLLYTTASEAAQGQWLGFCLVTLDLYTQSIYNPR